MTETNDIIQYARSNKKWARYRRVTISKGAAGIVDVIKQRKIAALHFLGSDSAQDLARLLNRPILFLEQVLNHPVYVEHQIAKKNGSKRIVLAPSDDLKRIQRSLNYYLQCYYNLIKPDVVFGFVRTIRREKNPAAIVQNAEVHQNKKYLLNLDLENFFPSISAKRILTLFSGPHFQFNSEIGTAIALLTTYQGKLPVGAPTSPILSNFICLEMDHALIDFANSHHLSYTRYADDLTFSSNEFIRPEILIEIRTVIEQNKFKLNEKKLRFRNSGKQQIVTGLTVNQKVNVDRKLLKKVRAMSHDLTKNGIELACQRHFKNSSLPQAELNEKFMNRLKGYVDFIGQVRGREDMLYQKLKGA
jgi:RNA-directed DNA polymerase